jgi:hypothetical protein
MSRDPMNPLDDTEFTSTTDENLNARFNDARERVSDIASRVRDKAGHVAETVSEKLDQQRETAAGSLRRAASTIHQNAQNIPGGPKVVHLTHRLADGMESTASYLRDHDVNQMGTDALNVCRRYPGQTLIAALALGFLLGRSRR